MRALRCVLSAFCAAVTLGGCSGGSAPVTAVFTTARVEIALKFGSRAGGLMDSRRRGPQYVSAATNGIEIRVFPTGTAPPAAPTLYADVSPASKLCTSPGPDGSRSCALAFAAPSGTDDFSIAATDQPPGSATAPGNILSAGTLHAVAIVPGQVNALAVALGGVVSKIVPAPAILRTVADGQVHTLSVAVNVQDADGNFIVGSTPFDNPLSVAVAGDANRTVSVSAPSSGADQTKYTVIYNGGALSDATLAFSASGASGASVDVTPLVVAPKQLTLPFGVPSSETFLTASEALDPNALSAAVSDPACATLGAPPSPGPPGATYAFTIATNATGPASCTLTVADGAGTSAAVAVNVAAPTGSTTFTIAPGKIAHVVFIIQENRSFDDLFSNYKAIDGSVDTVSSGKDSTGATVPLRVQPLAAATTAPGGNASPECWDPGHYEQNFGAESDGGKQDAFDRDSFQVFCAGYPPNPPPDSNGVMTGVYDWAYAAVQAADVQPYYAMAAKYALADHMYQSNSSASFVAHIELVAAQGLNQYDLPSAQPWGCDAPPGTVTQIFTGPFTPGTGPFPCFAALTFADELDARGVSWRYYAPAIDQGPGGDPGQIWSIYDAFPAIRYGPDWAGGATPKVVNPSTQIIADIAAGNFAAMNWVVPPALMSDHPRFNDGSGPSYVASIVNAVGQSKFWNSTAIFVLWDDWGGWYDHEPPIALDLEGLGLRVPLIAISPYAKHGYISHTQYEFGSLLKFAEEALNLPTFGQTDARSTSPADMFDFTQAPSVFSPFASVRSKRQIMDSARRQERAGPAPDTN